jgi:hypothetical protein
MPDAVSGNVRRVPSIRTYGASPLSSHKVIRLRAAPRRRVRNAVRRSSPRDAVDQALGSAPFIDRWARSACPYWARGRGYSPVLRFQAAAAPRSARSRPAAAVVPDTTTQTMMWRRVADPATRYSGTSLPVARRHTRMTSWVARAAANAPTAGTRTFHAWSDRCSFTPEASMAVEGFGSRRHEP